MSTFTTAAATFDTAVTTFLTALATFQTAAGVVVTATVSASRPDGNALLSGGTGPKIMQKMMHYAAWQQLLQECNLQDVITQYAQGGTPGVAGPLTVLATVFNGA